jgi:hypothetical protein
VQIIASGAGTTLLPRLAVRVEARDRALATVAFRKPEPARTIGLAWRPTCPHADDRPRLAPDLPARGRLPRARRAADAAGGGVIRPFRPSADPAPRSRHPAPSPFARDGAPLRSILVERRTTEPSLFREFAVIFVDWKLERGDEVVPITGSGRYSVGGEFAVQQRMELDLRVGDGPAQHFDSGLVAGGGEFPEIDVRISVNQQVCFDTVIDILASPLPGKS